MEHVDILIVGAGAAGISAAKAAAGTGKSVALVDRGEAMGGVLLQCAHRGFGKQLTGPEYTRQLLLGFPKTVRFLPKTTVLSISHEKIAALNGGRTISFDRLILATGCRCIPAGALPIAGTRPKGVYTAGQMQEMMNLHGYRPEGPAVILGSGDLGLIMAQQLTDAGVQVAAIVEKSSRIGAMTRNQRFLQTVPIPLYLNDTISELHGYPRLEGVSLAGGAYIPCKTLLTAVGLRPEQELIRHLGNPRWLTLCGNCRTVHPMVEAVVNEGIQAGIAAGKE